ncbi:MAG: family transporter [Bacillota bacterium]|jgi:predicted PurR-regulated permease PerM|nr:family transporter [Bacillota bacterium]
MSKLKEMLSDWKYIKFCLYVVFTAALLYVLYFVIKNFNMVIMGISNVLGSMATAFAPLITGLIIAYLLSPLVEFINKKFISKLFVKLPSDPMKLEKRLGLQRTISILITFLLIFVIICIIIYAFAFLIVGDLVFTSLHNMVDSIVNYFMKYESSFRSWIAAIPNTTGIEERIQDFANEAISWVSKNFSTAAIFRFITNISGSILNTVLGIVVSIYLLKDKEFFLRLWRKLLHLVLPMKANAVVTETLSDINQVVSQFLRGQLLDALFIAILSSIGLSVIGLDFAVFIGCFAGLCNIIPYFGPIISTVPAALIGFMTGGVSQGLLAILVLVIIQQIDANILYPRVVGSSTGLHPLFILISVTVGGYYAGIIGMILAVPIAAIIKVLIMKRLDSVD